MMESMGSRYKLNPDRDFFQKCTTILNSEEAAFVKAEQIVEEL